MRFENRRLFELPAPSCLPDQGLGRPNPDPLQTNSEETPEHLTDTLKTTTFLAADAPDFTKKRPLFSGFVSEILIDTRISACQS